MEVRVEIFHSDVLRRWRKRSGSPLKYIISVTLMMLRKKMIINVELQEEDEVLTHWQCDLAEETCLPAFWLVHASSPAGR